MPRFAGGEIHAQEHIVRHGLRASGYPERHAQGKIERENFERAD
jgi:hypothetical protein